MKSILYAIFIVGMLYPVTSPEPGSGSLCVAPIAERPIPMAAPGLICASEKLSFTIDSLPRKTWPIKESIKFDGLDLGASHRVAIFCEDKAQQSFKFRYSEFKERKLCLFINDLYKTAQLWEDKQSPWCKCKAT
jgi:hypothetical protein